MKKNIINTLKNQRTLWAICLLLVGFFLGWLIFHRSATGASATKSSAEQHLYTCSMHPQIKQEQPGLCPICGMDLIPFKAGGGAAGADSDIDPDAVMLSPEAMALANVQTQEVGTGAPSKQVRLFGKVGIDQRQEQIQSAYVNGRVERLFITAVGDRVRRGQTLAIIYSPELYTASQELVAALGYPDPEQREMIVDAAREKLRLLNIDNSQINNIIKTRKASPYMTLKANVSGTVMEKNVEQGNYVKQGEKMFRIANLNRVWMLFQAYEADLPFLKVGQSIRFGAESLPGRSFTGKITFIDPVINNQTRTAGIRVEMDNSKGIFKPDMMLTGNVNVRMSGYGDDIVVPKSAVLWTGKRSVVYIMDDSDGNPTFTLREVVLGPALADGYVITDGIAEGEQVVTNGAFAIDASAQLDGRPSMMDH